MKTYFKILNIGTLTLFFGMLLLPMVNDKIHLIKEADNSENRVNVTKPEYKDTLIDEYIKAYDDYYTDNFSLRNNFIKLLNQLQFSLFKVSSVPDRVLVGKDGWFYEPNCARNYKGANLFTDSELVVIKNDLINRAKWAAKRGIKYYLALVPNKMNVYPEHLPNHIIKVSDETRYDQIVKLNNGSTINIIDIRKNILPHKSSEYDLYQHTDDHWNDLGAYYGYEEIMKRLNKDFPELKPMPLSDFKIGSMERYGNMASMINVEKDYPEKFITLTSKRQVYGHWGNKKGYKHPPRISDEEYEFVTLNENGKNLTCLVIRDSFTLLMMKWLQEHFKKCVFIHDEWMYRMREDIILKEKPDLVLNIVLETEVHKLLEFPFLWSSDQKLEQNVSLIAANGKYVCADENRWLIANRENVGEWETFKLVSLEKGQCALLSHENYFLSSDIADWNKAVANREKISDWEKFKLIDLGDGFFAFKANNNNKYLSLDDKTQQLFTWSETLGKNEKFKLQEVK